MADELPLMSSSDPVGRPHDARNGDASKTREQALSLQREQAAAAADGKMALWWWQATRQLSDWTGVVWGEARTLLRVTRIDHPEAALVSRGCPKTW
jgi:uroporphyrin-3 C-methyltransferase